jgi:putative ABC transport system substrate-binding protein
VKALASRYRMPVVYPYRFMIDDGGLISYGIDQLDLYRRAPVYVDRVLRGANPADLPVQLPTKFEMAVNLKIARELGLTLPATLLGRADEVIE